MPPKRRNFWVNKDYPDLGLSDGDTLVWDDSAPGLHGEGLYVVELYGRHLVARIDPKTKKGTARKSFCIGVIRFEIADEGEAYRVFKVLNVRQSRRAGRTGPQALVPPASDSIDPKPQASAPATDPSGEASQLIDPLPALVAERARRMHEIDSDERDLTGEEIDARNEPFYAVGDVIEETVPKSALGAAALLDYVIYETTQHHIEEEHFVMLERVREFITGPGYAPLLPRPTQPPLVTAV